MDERFVCRVLPAVSNTRDGKESCGKGRTASALLWARRQCAQALSNFQRLSSNMQKAAVRAVDIAMTGSSMKEANQSTRYAILSAIAGSPRNAFSLLFLAALTLSALSISTEAQTGFAISGQAVTPTGTPAYNAQITVCPYTATGIPCNPQASIWNNSALSGSPITQPTATDAYGNYHFWVTPGTTYLVQVKVNFTVVYSYYVSANAGGSGPGVTLQTNSVNNVSQSLLNLLNGQGISIVNTTGGNVQFSLATNTCVPSAGNGYFLYSNGNGCASGYIDIGQTTANTLTSTAPNITLNASTGTGLITLNSSGLMQLTSATNITLDSPLLFASAPKPVAGGPFCLQISNTGQITNTGAVCGGGGSGTVPVVPVANWIGFYTANLQLGVHTLPFAATIPSGCTGSTGLLFALNGGAVPTATGTIVVNWEDLTSSTTYCTYTWSASGTNAVVTGSGGTTTAGHTFGFVFPGGTPDATAQNFSFIVNGTTPGGGGGGSLVLETNGVSNASQSLLNFVNAPNFNGLGINFVNSSGGIETLSITGTLNNAGLTNSTMTINGVTCTLGATCTVPGGSGTPGGSPGQVQFNSGGSAFGGFTVGGDGTLNTSTGTLLVTKTNGVAFGTFATQNYATPPAIGGTTPNTGAFSSLTIGSLNGCLTATAGVISAAGSCGASPLWNTIGNPAGNQALSMTTFTTTWTWGAATGSSDLFKLTDTASNTGTGILAHFTTASGSTEIPWQADANGVGWKIGTDGSLTGVGSAQAGTLNFGQGTAPGSLPTHTVQVYGASSIGTSYALILPSSAPTSSNGRLDCSGASTPFTCTWQAASASGVSSFTGDGALLNNSVSTGAVTATLANAGAHKYWGNNTGSSTAPAYVSIVAGDLPAIPLSGLATQAADTVVQNATGSSAVPTAVAMPTCTSGSDLYNTSTHSWSCVATPVTIASGTAAMGTSAISSGSCATAVTVSATGVATTDSIIYTPNADPTGVTGYAVSATGSLYIWAYPTANNVNFKVCNNTAGSLTPSALTLNWRVSR